MAKLFTQRLVVPACFLALPAALWALNAQAAPRKAAPRMASLPRGAKAAASAPLPQYVSLATIERLRKERAQIIRQGLDGQAEPVLQPVWEGHALQQDHPMRDLLTGPAFDSLPPAAPRRTANGKLLAQRGSRPLPPSAVPSVRPATIRPVAAAISPKWVRYPLEFQLCGIGLGTRAVDKDKYDRIDRYGLFALHGNPTAVVVPALFGGVISVQQQPPEVAALFPAVQGDGIPDWAAAITVSLDNNHVEWLYRRETYSMGFIVDRLGFVDAIVVAGIQSNIARTQLEDPLHTVKLGDDFRKVMFRYGYPDTLETYGINVAAGISTVTTAPAGVTEAAEVPSSRVGAALMRPGVENRTNFQVAPPANGAGTNAADAGGGAAAGAGTGVYRTFEVRYEQSYNVVFTIRNNRVIRMYIFGDPDFFNERRRNLLRSQY